MSGVEARYSALIHNGYEVDESAEFPAGSRVVIRGETGTVEAPMVGHGRRVLIVALDNGTAEVAHAIHCRAVA